MAEKSCDVGNTANTNDYIKTDNNDSNPDGGSNIKRVSSKSISKLLKRKFKQKLKECMFTTIMFHSTIVVCIVELKLENYFISSKGSYN